MKIRVVTKKPNEKPEIVDFEDELNEYQRFVGGCIECYEVISGVNFVINEDGKFLRLMPNIICPEFDDFFVGNILAAGVDFEAGCFLSLTDEQVQKVIDYFNKYHIEDGRKIVCRNTECR